MMREPYKRRPRDMEIRILKDGRVIFVSPDESLMDVAQAVDGENAAMKNRSERHAERAGQLKKRKLV